LAWNDRLELCGKRIELLHETVPAARTVAWLVARAANAALAETAAAAPISRAMRRRLAR
jgi:hypothetical protein